jgi:hypothetical protein
MNCIIIAVNLKMTVHQNTFDVPSRFDSEWLQEKHST